MKMQTVLFSVLIAGAHGFAAAASVRLPAGGTEVVIAPSAPPAVRFAAAEATNFLSQTFGAAVPLATEPTAGRSHLFLGTNAWSAAAGVDV